MMYVLQLLITEKSNRDTLEKIDTISPNDIIVSEKIIQHLPEIIERSRIKLILFYQNHDYTDRAPPDFHTYTLKEIIIYLLRYPVPDHEHPVRGAYRLSILYYKMQGSYANNARFLFGTASQFCR
jgi:hypothetical protein